MSKLSTRPSSGLLSSFDVEERLKVRHGRFQYALRNVREGGIVCRKDADSRVTIPRFDFVMENFE